MTVAVAGHANLGANVLEVAFGETAGVAVELEFGVLIAVVFVVAQAAPTEEQQEHQDAESSFHSLLQRLIIINNYYCLTISPNLLAFHSALPSSSCPPQL